MCIAEVRDLVDWLEDLCSGFTQEEIAGKIARDRKTISRLLSKKSLPLWGLVEAVVCAFSGDLDEAQVRWDRAREVMRTRDREGYPTSDFPLDNETLCAELCVLMRRRGISQREAVRRDRSGILRRSTLGAMLRGQRRFNPPYVEALVTVCGASDEAIRAWGRECIRLDLTRRDEMARRKHDRYAIAVQRYGQNWYYRTIVR